MQPENRAALLEFEPPTELELAALRHARQLNRMTPQAYLVFLEEFSDMHPPSREIVSWPKPFTLEP